MNNKALPRIDNVRWLANLARPYPTTASEMLVIARAWGFSKGTQDFLELFAPDTQFANSEDFTRRVQDLELLMHEESSMPVEMLRSPQG